MLFRYFITYVLVGVTSYDGSVSGIRHWSINNPPTFTRHKVGENQGSVCKLGNTARRGTTHSVLWHGCSKEGYSFSPSLKLFHNLKNYWRLCIADSDKALSWQWLLVVCVVFSVQLIHFSRGLRPVHECCMVWIKVASDEATYLHFW